MQTHRTIIKNRIDRRRRQQMNPYLKFIGEIVIVQSCIRRYLAKIKYLSLQNEEKNAGALIIQYNWRNICFRREIKKRCSARIISRFIRNVPVFRQYRLTQIRRQLSRLQINRFVNRLVRERRERQIRLIQQRRAENERRIEEIRNRPRLLPTPPNMSRPNYRDRLNEYIRQRDERINNRDDNMEAIRDRINRITTNIEENLERHNAIFRRNNILPAQNEGQINRVRPVTRIRPQEIRRNPITHQIPILPALPELQQPPVINNRIMEIERELRNPRMRQIYEENRIFLPTGHRILPARNGGITLEGPENHQDITFIEPESNIKINCPICMDDVGINRAIKFTCDHSICKMCLQGLINSALNNISELPLRCPFFNSGCTTIINPSEHGIRQLLSQANYNKFERLSILKMHVPDERLKYCPNSQCQMPYELIDADMPSEAPKIIDFRFFVTCFDCNQHICTFCNDTWHEGLSCHEFQNRTTANNEETSKYIRNYCKKCPNCNVNVQKIQTREQELYEQRTGMAGGTSECHHVTCGNCKRDFCWTCVKMYRGATYYHPNCPNVDCIIDFISGYPSIRHLPLGKIETIKMIIHDNDNEIIEEKIYRTHNRNRILDNPNNYQLRENTVFLYCRNDGIVTKLQGMTGEYSFRQESKYIVN